MSQKKTGQNYCQGQTAYPYTQTADDGLREPLTQFHFQNQHPSGGRRAPEGCLESEQEHHTPDNRSIFQLFLNTYRYCRPCPVVKTCPGRWVLSAPRRAASSSAQRLALHARGPGRLQPAEERIRPISGRLTGTDRANRSGERGERRMMLLCLTEIDFHATERPLVVRR